MRPEALGFEILTVYTTKSLGSTVGRGPNDDGVVVFRLYTIKSYGEVLTTEGELEKSSTYM